MISAFSRPKNFTLGLFSFLAEHFVDRLPGLAGQDERMRTTSLSLTGQRTRAHSFILPVQPGVTVVNGLAEIICAVLIRLVVAVAAMVTVDRSRVEIGIAIVIGLTVADARDNPS